ncbi:MAG TPA: hypothetical protein VLX90_14090, partial [Steroidobacteraceae bacterium]|nr:hypothetical protein [Steroidobacteraceae bacterium]
CWLPVIAVDSSQQLSDLQRISDGRVVLRRPRRQGSDRVGSDVALGATGGDRVPKRPRSSKSLQGFSAGFAARMRVSVSRILRTSLDSTGSLQR